MTDFLGSSQTLYDNERTVLSTFPVDRTGAINNTIPVFVFADFQVQSVQETDNEKTQIALSSDEPKLYAFGRHHRFYTFQGVLLDTNLNRDIRVETDTFSKSWTGNLLSEWQDYYDNYAKLSVCADKRYLVQLTYVSKKLLGAINQMSITADASQPNKYDLVFSFYVTHEEVIEVI